MNTVLRHYVSVGSLLSAFFFLVVITGVSCSGTDYEDYGEEISDDDNGGNHVQGDSGDGDNGGNGGNGGGGGDGDGYFSGGGDGGDGDGYYPSEYDNYLDFDENEFIDASEEDTSTFSIDVNTAAYTIMRRDLNAGTLPDPDSVRTEEYINFFRFDYPEPDDGPFSINMELGPSYFGTTDEQERHLLRIGLRGEEVSIDDMNDNNLVFLVDVSGSMSSDDRLPLAKDSLYVLLDHLRDTDTVGIQTYASGSETLLEPTAVGGSANRAEIEEAIDSLEAYGSTWGEGGIIDAYEMAEEAFIEGGNNRVIILTDGDFNVGKTGDDLVELVKSYRDLQISLTSVGYGHGGYNDSTMEQLARDGNGNYFYIDTIEEAERIFGSELPSTVQVIAEDVRTQVKFNEDAVDRYRLIGYEKRVMDNEDFDDEDTNAGELGPGHTVTAFYEMELFDQGPDTAFLAEVKLRHREQYGEETKLQTELIKRSQIQDEFDDTSDGFRFAAAVVEFAAILGESQYVEGARFDEIYDIADDSRYDDYADQDEFLDLVDIAEGLWDE